eukprot:scaffold100539_cov51-Attheya_sp.AAC.4
MSRAPGVVTMSMPFVGEGATFITIKHFHFVVLFAAESGWCRDDEALAGQGDASACFWGVLGVDVTSAGHRFACNDLDGQSTSQRDHI